MRWLPQGRQAIGRHLAWIWLSALLAAALAGAPARAQSQPASPPPAGPLASVQGLTPEDARRALEILTDDNRRAEMIGVLQTVARAAPPVSAGSAPAAGPVVAPVTEREPAIESGGLLSQVLVAGAGAADAVLDRTVMVIRPLAGLPAAWSWLIATLTDPATQALLLDIAWKVGLALSVAFLVEWLARRALTQPRRRLRAAAEPGPRVPPVTPAGPAAPLASPAPEDPRPSLTWRSLLAAAGFLLDMGPVIAFAVVAIGFDAVATFVTGDTYQLPRSRLIMIALVNAHVVWRVLTALARRATMPEVPRIRLLPLDDADAAWAYGWLRKVLGVLVYGFALLEIARVLGISYVAYTALLKLVMLVTHLMVIGLVLHCRGGVAAWIRGHAGRYSLLNMLLGGLAAIWHLAAIFILLALWIVWAADIRDGYVLLLRYLFSTALVLVVAQLLSVTVLKGLDRLFTLEARDLGRFSMVQERASRYLPHVRRLVMAIGGVLTVLALFQVWGFDAIGWFEEDSVGSRLLSAIVIVAIAGALALALWEGVNAAVERHLDELGHRGDRARAARLRTLLPLLRTSLLVFVVGVVGLTALSEIGVNIAPLLAGAGIVGVAIGFGSQKLVQDVITGVFLLLENVMHVGDWVTLGGLSGSVENLSIRTIRLRAGDGSVHVIPFSSVTTVTNTNRGIGNAAVSVSVAHDEDTDRVGEVLKGIAAEMREDPAFHSSILNDLELWGVDAVNGAAVTIAGQIRCLDSGRWGVQREFNRRMKKRFQELGIELADPSRRLLVRPERQVADAGAWPEHAARGEAPGPTSATATRSPPPAALGHGK